MDWREAHRRRVMALEDAAAAVLLSQLDLLLSAVARRFASVSAAAPDDPGQAKANLDDLAALGPAWRQEVDQSVAPWFGDVFRKGARAAEEQVAETTATVPPEIAPRLIDHAAETYLAGARNRFYSLGDAAWSTARDELLAGFQAGEGIPELRQRITDVTGLSRSAADALARTEVIAASNLGADARVDLMGDDAPRYKQWLATMDSRTRPTHRHADGQVVARSDRFEVGAAYLKVPGDPSGPPEEVVNCRCTTLYVDSAEGMDLETGRQIGGPVDIVAELGITAAAGPPQIDTTTGEPHTGAMVALVPAEPAALVLDTAGAEPADALHLTLAYLGEAEAVPSAAFQALQTELAMAAQALPVVDARIFGAALWNTTSDTPSVVASVGGPQLDTYHDVAWSIIQDAAYEAASEAFWPTQHAPWVGHVCLIYSPPTVDIQAIAAGLEGPVRFDRIRLTYGADAYDYPLSGQPMMEDTPMDQAQFDARMANIRASMVITAASPAPTGMMDGPPPQPGEHLRALMHVEGKSTGQNGSGRTFTNLSFRETPFAYHWQKAASAHGGQPVVVPVGLVTRVVEDGDNNWGFIQLDLANPDGMEAGRQVVDGFGRWVSIGADETKATVTLVWPEPEPEPDPEDPNPPTQMYEPDQVLIDGAHVAELTQVSTPAQADAVVEPTPELVAMMRPEDRRVALVAAVAGSTSLPVGDRDAAWDGAGAASRVFDLYTDPVGNVDTAGVGKAFLWKDPDADPATKAAYKLGFADVVNGKLTIIPKGVAATAGGRGVNAADIPGDAKTAVKSKICTLYGKVKAKYDDWPDCPFSGDGNASALTLVDRELRTIGEMALAKACGCGGGSSCSCDTPESDIRPENIGADVTPADRVQAITAAAYTITLNELPPARWFRPPADVPMDSGLTISPEGRVWGLLAPLGTGHRAWAKSGGRLDVPWGNVDYDRFMGATTLTADGPVPAGPLTMDCGHADMWRPTHDAAREHYDNACSIIGAIAVGEDQGLGGVWIAGALLPKVTPDQVARALMCRCSGDWQPHPDKPGWSELVACLLVPTPGFATARTTSTTIRDGALVASAVPVQFRPDTRDPAARRRAAALRWAADQARPTPAARLAEVIGD